MHLGFRKYEGLKLHVEDLVHQPEPFSLNLQPSTSCLVYRSFDSYLVHGHIVCPTVARNSMIVSPVEQKRFVVLFWELSPVVAVCLSAEIKA
jgi:hypothetical protein